jgi:aldose 1-epimerase
MLYQVRTLEKKAGKQSGPVVELFHSGGQCRAEIWADHGFNCLRWQVSNQSSNLLHDVLYKSADWETNPVPTRSGHPILFPFPNRIRNASFRFEEKEYNLPRNDSTKTHGIHGYAPRNPWRILSTGCDDESAWVTGQFQPSIDNPEVLPYWPADYILTITYRLKRSSLVVESKVHNPSSGNLPWGLGYHGYFRFPPCLAEAPLDRYRLHMPANKLWELQDSLTTGKMIPIPDALDWSRPHLIDFTQIDAVYGELGRIEEFDSKLIQRANVRHIDYPGALRIWTDESFREMVLFTPPHRQAIAIEPYTCTTDAINLQAQGIDAGLQILSPGQSWEGIVEYQWDAKATQVWKT